MLQDELPEDNYDILKFVIQFLVEVRAVFSPSIVLLFFFSVSSIEVMLSTLSFLFVAHIFVWCGQVWCIVLGLEALVLQNICCK